MSKEKKLISNKQFRNILICIMWPATINYGSGILARKIGSDMWISGLISVLTVLPFIVIIIRVGQKFPGKTIAEYSTNLLGGYWGKLWEWCLQYIFSLLLPVQ